MAMLNELKRQGESAGSRLAEMVVSVTPEVTTLGQCMGLSDARQRFLSEAIEMLDAALLATAADEMRSHGATGRAVDAFVSAARAAFLAKLQSAESGL